MLTYESYLEIASKTPIRSAVINITDNCNLRCRYCFTHQNPRIITPEILEKTARFLYEEKNKAAEDYTPSISFFGGEPSLCLESIIFPFIQWTKNNRLKFKFNMTTNGTLLTEERLKRLVDNNVGILFSIDGAKHTQDAQRPLTNGSSSFDILKENIPNILKYYPNVTFRSAINPENVDDMVENYLFARAIGFRNYFITPNVYSDGWQRENIFKASFYLWAITSVMLDDIQKHGGTLFFNDITRYIKNFTETEKKEFSIKRCGLGITGIGVACDGAINGCQEHNTYLDEDVFKIGDIENGVDPLRGFLLAKTYEQSCIEKCDRNSELYKNCSYKDFCSEFGCPSRNIAFYQQRKRNNLISCYWQQTLSDIAKYWIAKGGERVMNYCIGGKRNALVQTV